MAEAKKAPDDGTYVWNGRQYRARAGKTMPPGATFGELKEADISKEDTAKAAKKRKRATGKGPDESTQGQGPSETS